MHSSELKFLFFRVEIGSEMTLASATVSEAVAVCAQEGTMRDLAVAALHNSWGTACPRMVERKGKAGSRKETGGKRG